MPKNASAKKTRPSLLKGAKTHFDTFVSALPAHHETPLPFTHTTDAYDMRDILESRVIVPRSCTVFNKDLSYYYYGRPAYRKNGSIQANNIAAYAPIVFVLRPEMCSESALAFPFDSGAFKDERYDDITHHRMRVEDFGLEASLAKFASIVAYFYGSNLAYYDQICETNPKIPQMAHEIQAYRGLVNSYGKNKRDDRSTTIEMILDHGLKLDDNLKAIVVPNSLFMDTEFKTRIRSFQCKILTYADGAKLTPASHVPLLEDVVRRFYIKQGLFK